MNRRQFVGTLLAGLGAVVAAPHVTLWYPLPEWSSIPLAPEAIVGLDRLTREFAHRLQHGLGISPVPLTRLLERQPLSISDQVKGETLNNHLQVMVAVPIQVDRYGLDFDRYVQPAVDLFIGSIRHKGRIVGCGELNLSSDVIASSRYTDDKSGLSLRGRMTHEWNTLEAYDGTPTIRFDILLAQK